LIRESIASRGSATVILATGTSQFETLTALRNERNIDWSVVACFHLDEYVGMTSDHPASFVGYLKKRFHSYVPDLREFVYLDGTAHDPYAECRRASQLLDSRVVDVAFIGIGENAHLAFNDPPADFDTEDPYIVVNLDHACRMQQLGEGWFPTIDQVPTRAMSMSIRQILKSRNLIVSVPDERKARAVSGAVQGPIKPECPASILQTHNSCDLFLDHASASLLNGG
jgi:glucosamine-6-phosphate deaminase